VETSNVTRSLVLSLVCLASAARPARAQDASPPGVSAPTEASPDSSDTVVTNDPSAVGDAPSTAESPATEESPASEESPAVAPADVAVTSIEPTAPSAVSQELAAPIAQEPVREPEEDPTPPVSAEWGRGLLFHSDDDLFSMQIRGRMQIQGFVESGVSSSDPASADFMIRRGRLLFRGHLLDANLEYYVQLGMAPRDMDPDPLIPVPVAQLAWTGLRDLSIRAGVMKIPFSRERVISSSALQLVDRSIVNAELAVDRDNGIQLYSNDLFGLGGYLGYQLGIFGGDGRLRVNNDLGLLYVARVQVQPFGRFDDQLSEADLTRQERVRLSIGAGFAYNGDTNRRRRTTTDFYRAPPTRFSYMHAAAHPSLQYAGLSPQSDPPRP